MQLYFLMSIKSLSSIMEFGLGSKAASHINFYQIIELSALISIVLILFSSIFVSMNKDKIQFFEFNECPFKQLHWS